MPPALSPRSGASTTCASCPRTCAPRWCSTRPASCSPGRAELAAPARALLAAGGGAAELEAGGDEGVVCAVRSDAHAAVAVCGRFAIGAVVREDLRTALAALEGRAVAGSDEPAAAIGRSPAGALDRGSPRGRGGPDFRRPARFRGVTSATAAAVKSPQIAGFSARIHGAEPKRVRGGC